MKKHLAMHSIIMVLAVVFTFAGYASAQTVLPHKNPIAVKRVPPKLIHIHITKRINTKKPTSTINTKTTTTSKQKK